MLGVSQAKKHYGDKPNMGQYATAGASEMLGGAPGLGLGEKKSTLSQQLANILIGTVLGGLTGIAIGGLPGAIVGAIAGALGRAIGSERMMASYKPKDWIRSGTNIAAPDNSRNRLDDLDLQGSTMALFIKENKAGHAATKGSVDELAKYVKQQNDTTTSDVEADHCSTGDTAVEGLAGWPLEVWS
jgi:hypothetical protein